MNKKYLIICIWIILILVLKECNIITLNLLTIKNYLNTNKSFAMLIFLLLCIIRIFVFVPGVTFMILGGLCFGPIEGFILCMLGIITFPI